MNIQKITKGQYFTVHNPFHGDLFSAWQKLLPSNTTYLEPFAGAGNLFDFIPGTWSGFDIEPQHPAIAIRDTLKDFPKGFKVCITNPPYLARVSATRRNLNVNLIYSDLYLDCLEQCLLHCDYVAAIIPSTFFNQPLFKERLFAWDKIDYELFTDTDAPVGVAYFVPEHVHVPLIGVNGSLLDLKLSSVPTLGKSSLVFNPPDPTHTLIAIDTVNDQNIHIKPYDGEIIKQTNRHIVPFKNLPCSIDEINNLIDRWREATNDFYLTSFMSCMKSGKYRKRITFNNVHWLINLLTTPHLLND